MQENKKIEDDCLENVTGGQNVCGGICGAASDNVTIENCVNSGNITGNANNAGGICGTANNTDLNIQCYNTGDIEDPSQYTGGFVGKVD